MAVLTSLEKLNIGRLSAAFAAVDILKSGLDGGGIDLELPIKITYVQESIQWLYGLDSSDSTLFPTTNFLYALCGKYKFAAENAISGGGSIAPIAGEPVTPITISGSDFANTTDWEYAPYAGKNVTVFSNGIARYLTALTEWQYISTGIRILMPFC